MPPLGFGYDDDEEDDEQPRAKIARPTPDATPPLALRGVAPPHSTDEMTANADKSRGMNASALSQTMQPSPLTQRRTADETTSQQLSKGSGISQIQNPWARGALRGLNLVGSALGGVAPIVKGVMTAIPGTEEHHDQLVRRNQRAIGSDIEQEGKEAQTAETQARIPLTEAQTRAAGQLKPKEENWQPFAASTDMDGTPLLHEVNSGQVVRADNHQPPTGFKAVAPKQDKPDSPEQQFIDDETKRGIPLAKAIQDYALASQPPDRPEKPPRQMIVGPDGRVIELHPGDVVPQGSKTVTGDLTNKPTADEQRRSDLSENLNENLATLEEIVGRRPDLFGPMAGRITGIKGALGSNDPDIGTLETIKHQIGMAQISAHGMRSAQGIGSAADSILNSFKNGPEAVKASINAARNSVKTFGGDVDRAKNGANQPAPSGKTLSMQAIQQAAKDHGVSVDEAKRQAQAAGYAIQ